ncbi:MAG: hypothetical protein JNK48_12400 [Bryobacterales bacterium]|nr:hypothetical protein [Bryobacterales bacterium]
MRLRFLVPFLFLSTLPAAQWVLLRTTDGAVIEGETALASVKLSSTALKLGDILSVHNAAEPSTAETAKITAGLAAIQGADRKARDLAVEELTNIGVPVLTPLLTALKDTDQHEPRPLYRLFERIMPSNADGFDRSLSIVRLRNGEALRGTLAGATLELRKPDGSKQSLQWSTIRTLAVRQRAIRRTIAVHSLKHCQQIEYLDTGIVLSAASRLDSTARGFARLSWNADVWACDPDGLKKPAGGNYKTNLFDGHPFGALIGRIGAAGEVFFVGTKAAKTGLPAGRLTLAVNDNRHWQNNAGTYTVTLAVTEAYDTGDAQ